MYIGEMFEGSNFVVLAGLGGEYHHDSHKKNSAMQKLNPQKISHLISIKSCETSYRGGQ